MSNIEMNKEIVVAQNSGCPLARCIKQKTTVVAGGHFPATPGAKTKDP